MDTRTALRGSFVSRQLVAIGLVMAAMVLGFTAAFGAQALVAGGAGSVGSGASSFAAGPAWDDSNRHHGTQSGGGPVDTMPAYRAPSSIRPGPQE